MRGLSDDTQIRWGALPPEKFIELILHDRLEATINQASVRIHIYTRMVGHYTGGQMLADDAFSELNEWFTAMRTCIAEAAQLIRAENWDGLNPETYILETTYRIRWCTNAIIEWANTILADQVTRQVRFEGFNDRQVGALLEEILDYMARINLLLDFAYTYAQNRLRLLPLDP